MYEMGYHCPMCGTNFTKVVETAPNHIHCECTLCGCHFYIRRVQEAHCG